MSKGFTDHNMDTLINAMGGYLSGRPSKIHSIREEPWFLEAVKFRLTTVSRENVVSGYKELLYWRQNYDLNKAAEEDMGGLSLGDRVKILRAPTEEEKRSWPLWIEAMSAFIGKIGVIEDISPERMDCLVKITPNLGGPHSHCTVWTFPKNVLEKVQAVLPDSPNTKPKFKVGDIVSTTPSLSPTPTKGEPTMNSNEIRVLRELASKTEVDDLSKYTVALADGTEEAMKELLANEAKAAAMEQAHIILSIARKAKAELDDQVAALRSTRATEKAQLSAIRKIVRARDYAAESKNYLPLVFLLDGYVDGVYPEDYSVPESWQPEVKS
jgi:hypothetical protein